MGDNPNVALIKKRSTVIKHKCNNSKKSKTLNRNEKNGRGRVGWAIPGTLGNATVAAQERGSGLLFTRGEVWKKSETRTKEGPRPRRAVANWT